jgi:hypothetical protein
MSMRDAWEVEAPNWIAWARDPQDSYWRFHAERFFESLPAACVTLDVGCGEGRPAALLDYDPCLVRATCHLEQ